MMTIASSGISKVLNNSNCSIQDHLRNHTHLTNCIHLKNHMHMKKSKVMLDKQFPGDNSLMKDLIVLQRSRSLRDPSTSPSWNSPVIGSVMKKLENKGPIKEINIRGTKPLVGVRGKESRRALTASPLSQSDTSRKTTGFIGGFNIKDSIEDDRRLGRRRKFIGYALADSRLKHIDFKTKGRRKRLSDDKGKSDSELGRRLEPNDLNRNVRSLRDGCCHERRSESNPDLSSLSQRQIIRDRKDTRNISLKSLKGRLRNSTTTIPEGHSPYMPRDNNNIRKYVIHGGVGTGSAMDSRDHSTSHFKSHFHSHVPDAQEEKPKDSKLKLIEGSHFCSPKYAGQHHEHPYLSASLNSVDHIRISFNDFPDSEKTPVETGGSLKSAVTDVPKKGCGIPWNWSRIHDRGKSILDLAGRSLSCGLSDSATRKIEGLASQSHSSSHRDLPAALETSDYCTSSLDSDSESLPLLTEPGGSQESADTDALATNISGELDLYAGDLSVRPNTVMDSETRSTDSIGLGQNKKGSVFSRHETRNLIMPQKYVPKTFRELVGQSLVTQALTNAILRRKISPLYVFHGPHGTGKTSCARIFAAAMNCHSLEHSRPCGLCHSCLSQSLGKGSYVKEISGFGINGFDSFQCSLDNVVMCTPSSRYRVFIVEDCDILTSDDWNTFLKVIDEMPWNLVFIIIASKLDHIPHVVLSRCQKFLFSKLKEVDIVNKLQIIASQEDLEIDNEALTLIASRANGSMRDAEMTLDQLSLLGQRISLSLVQELVGLIPDEKLVDLLDLALSADTVNTVKTLRDLMEAGVEPLALMSQLATLITDILAGSYKLHRERQKKIFHKQTLSKEEMNRLRQALRTLSEAEKQLLLSNDRTTWLTAALLQLAPDPSNVFLCSSSGTSVIQSPASQREKEKNEAIAVKQNDLDKHSKANQLAKGSSMIDTGAFATRERIPSKRSGDINSANQVGSVDSIQSIRVAGGRNMPSLEDIMDLKTTDKMDSRNKEHNTRPENLVSSFSQACQSARSGPLGTQINCTPSKKDDISTAVSVPLDQSKSSNTIQKNVCDFKESSLHCVSTSDTEKNALNGIRNGLVVSEQGTFRSHNEASLSEIVGSEHTIVETCTGRQHIIARVHLDERLENASMQEIQSSPYRPTDADSCSETHTNEREWPESPRIPNSKSTRGFLIEQSQKSSDGFDQNLQQNNVSGSFEKKNGGHRGTDILTFISQEGITIAEKIEEENMRLESRSRGLLCWKASKVNSGKSMRFQTERRKPKLFQKLVPCARECS